MKDNIHSLLSTISVKKNILYKKKNYIITFNDQNILPFCVLLHDGVGSFVRQQDNMLIANIESPMIYGLNFYSQPINFYIRACSDIKYEIIDLKTAEEKINEKQLWRDVSLFHMQMIAYSLDYQCLYNGHSSYDTIINAISSLQHEPEFIRLRRTVSDYVIEKTLLSRSTVMKTLALLKKDKKITLQKGLLVNFHHPH